MNQVLRTLLSWNFFPMHLICILLDAEVTDFYFYFFKSLVLWLIALGKEQREIVECYFIEGKKIF